MNLTKFEHQKTSCSGDIGHLRLVLTGRRIHYKNYRKLTIAHYVIVILKSKNFDFRNCANTTIKVHIINYDVLTGHRLHLGIMLNMLIMNSAPSENQPLVFQKYNFYSKFPPTSYTYFDRKISEKTRSCVLK